VKSRASRTRATSPGIALAARPAQDERHREGRQGGGQRADGQAEREPLAAAVVDIGALRRGGRRCGRRTRGAGSSLSGAPIQRTTLPSA
jgi:hypothetical protein